MDKQFRVLRIIGTLWKVLAWIALIGGILLSLGMLLFGILGSGTVLLRFLGENARALPGAIGIVSSIVGFLSILIVSIIYFLVLYAVGELIFLLLAIEENTRRTMQRLERAAASVKEVEPSPTYPSD